MKTLVTFAVALVLSVIVLIAFPASGEESVYTDTLRLHILAASDDTADQEAKLYVRDAILSEYGDELRACKSRASAVAYVASHKDAIAKRAEEVLIARGLAYTVSVSLGEEWFDTRVYDDVTLPAGNYTALKITLGEGRGQNFWCMLYPALCLEPALGEEIDPAKEAYDESAYLLITQGGYAIKFRVLEILSSLFG